MVSAYRADQLKRFTPFLYLNHSFILSLNFKVYIRFIVFLQISLFFFICQELCSMKGLCISFTSSCFLLSVGGGSKKFEDWGIGEKSFCCGTPRQYPITYEEAELLKLFLSLPSQFIV